MPKELNTKQWIEILSNPNITKEFDELMLLTFYSFPDHEARSTEVARILGYNSNVVINGAVSRLAKRIDKETDFDIEFSQRKNRKYKFWDLFFLGRENQEFFYWKLKPELKKAIDFMKYPNLTQYAEEIDFEDQEKLMEGAKREIIVNSYERNPISRRKCIEHFKPICQVCEFNFYSKYGEIGKDFIHVHHIKPISEIGESYEINPIKDLIPVCPNCHSMLHIKKPMYSIDELKSIIKN